LTTFETLITPTSLSPTLSIGSPGSQDPPLTHTTLLGSSGHWVLRDAEPRATELFVLWKEKFFPFLFLRSRGGGEGEEGCKEVVEEGPVESAGECAKSSAILVGQVTKRECRSHETRV